MQTHLREQRTTNANKAITLNTIPKRKLLFMFLFVFEIIIRAHKRHDKGYHRIITTLK